MTKPLHQVLREQCARRRKMNRHGWSRQRDTEAALMLCEQFGINYPVADDARVRAWCRAHAAYVCKVVPSNKPGVRAALLQA